MWFVQKVYSPQKINKFKHSKYFLNTIHVKSTPYTTRNILLSAKHNFFKKRKGEDIFIKEENIFPFTEWSKFDPVPQDHLQILFTTVIISKEWKLLLELDLMSAIYKRISFVIVFKFWLVINVTWLWCSICSSFSLHCLFAVYFTVFPQLFEYHWYKIVRYILSVMTFP